MLMLQINISKLCLDLKSLIMRSLDDKSVSNHSDNNRSLILLPDEVDTERIKAILNDALDKSLTQNDYVIVDNAENEKEIAILKKGDIEEVGLYLCNLCAMIFGSKEEKMVHEQSHLFGFGF